MGNGGISNKCLILACLLVIVLLLIQKGKLDFLGGCPDFTPDQYYAFVRDNPIAFVKFYAPWCPHCTKLTGTMDELADAFKGDSSIGIGKINVDKHKDVGNKVGVRGFPTLKLFKNGKAVADYSGQRNVSSFKKFIESHK
jgi:protein disulfide-isomerase-like protein